MTCSNYTVNSRPIGVGYDSLGRVKSLSELTDIAVSSVNTSSITPIGATLMVMGPLSAVSYLGVTATAAAGGSNTQVQYNSGGSLAGNANLTYNGTTLTAASLSVGTVTGVSLADLDDVTITAAANGDVLIHNGTDWVDVPSSTFQIAGSYQPLDPTLTTLAALPTAANQMIYFTAADVATTTSITAEGRAVVGSISYAAMRSTMGLGSLAVLNSLAFGDLTDTFAWGGGEVVGDIISVKPGGNGLTYNGNLNYNQTTNLLTTKNINASSFSAVTVSAANFSGVSLSGSLRDVGVVTPGGGNALCWNNTTNKWSASSIGPYQPYDATLNALANQTTASDVLVYFSGVDATASCTITSAGRLFLAVTGTVATGDLFYVTSPTSVIRLAAGSNGALLYVDSSSKPAWSTVGGIGSMYYFDGSKVVRLNAGNEGATLQISGGIPAWVGP